MRSLVIAVALSLAFGSAALAKGSCRDAKGKFITCPPPAASPMKAKPQCSKGKPCGNSCIAKDKVCHKG